MNQTEWIKWCENIMAVQLRTTSPRKEIKSLHEDKAADVGVSLSNSMNKVNLIQHADNGDEQPNQVDLSD